MTIIEFLQQAVEITGHGRNWYITVGVEAKRTPRGETVIEYNVWYPKDGKQELTKLTHNNPESALQEVRASLGLTEQKDIEI
jgi:hypothetical protein